MRNKCAHHDLVWNNNFTDYAKKHEEKINKLLDPKDIQLDKLLYKTLYSRVILIWFILKNINPNSNWHKRLYKLIDSFPAVFLII